jgi:hypothetical protein
MIRPRLGEGEFDRRLVPAQPFHPEDDSMTKFVARYRPRIAAVLSGFDRLVFRGTLLPLVMPGGMFCFLQRAHVGLLDFKDYVRATSERLPPSSSAKRSSTTGPSATWTPRARTRKSSPASCSPNTRSTRDSYAPSRPSSPA